MAKGNFLSEVEEFGVVLDREKHGFAVRDVDFSFPYVVLTFCLSGSARAMYDMREITQGKNDLGIILPGHVSKEPADQKIMEELGMEPIIHARMALGEGTGGVLLLPLLDMALRVYQGPHTFAGLGMEAYTPQGGAQ